MKTTFARILIVLCAVVGLKALPVAAIAFISIVLLDLGYLLGYHVGVFSGAWGRWRIERRRNIRIMCLVIFGLTLVTFFTPASLFLTILVLLWVGAVSPLQYRRLVFGDS